MIEINIPCVWNRKKKDTGLAKFRLLLFYNPVLAKGFF